MWVTLKKWTNVDLSLYFRRTKPAECLQVELNTAKLSEILIFSNKITTPFYDIRLIYSIPCEICLPLRTKGIRQIQCMTGVTWNTSQPKCIRITSKLNPGQDFHHIFFNTILIFFSVFFIVNIFILLHWTRVIWKCTLKWKSASLLSWVTLINTHLNSSKSIGGKSKMIGHFIELQWHNRVVSVSLCNVKCDKFRKVGNSPKLYQCCFDILHFLYLHFISMLFLTRRWCSRWGSERHKNATWRD